EVVWQISPLLDGCRRKRERVLRRRSACLGWNASHPSLLRNRAAVLVPNAASREGDRSVPSRQRTGPHGLCQLPIRLVLIHRAAFTRIAAFRRIAALAGPARVAALSSLRA